jgi:dipeptidyl aminopeptidase/acylaminoacyl peptidase
VIIDLYDQKIETVFNIGPNTTDRVELYSPRASLLVVSTDAGGKERIGFARLRARESFWFPQETSSSTGIRALALDSSGKRLLLHEQRGVLSGLAVYDIANKCRKELKTDPGCIRGGATWNSGGWSVPWSSPMIPHSVLRLDNDERSPESNRKLSHESARIVTVRGAAGFLEGIAYGGRDWWLSRRLIVALHGGPVDAWRYEYDPLLQALASQGIAVLALNPRGSAGYGCDHVKAIHGAWGGPDLDDVATVIRELSRSRGWFGGLAILGFSYGAYLALLAACVIPRYLKACVAIAPFLSAQRLYEQGNTATRQHIDRLQGRRDINDCLGSRDVLRLAGRLEARCLLIHGSNDDVIPVEQSRAFCQHLTALGRRPGRDFQYLEVKAGAHDLLSDPAADTITKAISEFVKESD